MLISPNSLSSRETRPHSSHYFVAWIPPPKGFFAINTDGSSIDNPGESGFGELIRDENGNWVLGFFAYIGFTEIIHAELQGILSALQLAWTRNLNYVKCFTDSTHAIHLITNEDITYYKYGTIIVETKDLMSRNWRISIYHILREGNTCADLLAKKGASCSDRKLQILNVAPPEMSSLPLSDAMGTLHMRA